MPGTLLLVNPSKPRRRLSGGTASSMLTRPMSPSLHRSSRPQVKKAGVGSATKRANPKKATKKVAKKPAAKKAAKRSSKMPARKKMARRRVRRNPMDEKGTYYRMVKDKKTGKMVRKDYSGKTRDKLVKSAAGRRVTAGGRVYKGKAGQRTYAATSAKRPSDAALDAAFNRIYGVGKKKKKKVAAKKRPATAKRAAPARRASAASPAAKLRAQAKNMGLKSSGTVAQVKARIAAKKRRAAAKRAPAKKTARRAAPKKAATRRRRRTPSLATIEKRIRSARASARRSKAPRSVARRIHRTRGSALRLQKAARKGALSKRQKMMLRRHGLMRVNPSLKGITQDFVGLLPKAGVTVLATAGMAWGGQKLGDKLKGMKWMPEAVKPFAVPVATGGVTVGAFYAASMIKPLVKFRDAIMFGGLAAVAVHTLAAVKAKGAAGNEISLGAKLGLPIMLQPAVPATSEGVGEFVSIGDYIPQSLGRHYGEHLGDFVAIDGVGEAPSPYLDVDGTEIRLNGIFDESSLGEAPQMGYGREPARALDSAGDMTVEDVLAEADSGILAGSVFD